MTDIKPIVDYFRRSSTLPEPDPSWIRDCVQALVDDGQNPTPRAVHEQFLYSDLEQSSKPCIPDSAVAAHDTHLFASPTLLQVLSLTEIGASAYHLQTIQEQRRDVLQGRTRIRGMDDNEEEEDGEELEPGKLPDYPRSMLRFEVGDGRLVLKAIEYRRIPGLKLGETVLGTKILLHKVPVRRGILLLSPDNTRLMGGMIEHLEAEQPAQFVAGIKRRLETAQSGEDGAAPRKLPKATLLPSSTSSRTAKARTPAPQQNGNAPPARSRASRPLSKSKRAQEQVTVVDSDSEHAALSVPPASGPTSAAAARRRAAMLRAQAEAETIAIDVTDEFDETFEDESFLRHVDVAEAEAAARPLAHSGTADASRQTVLVDDDDDFDDFGDDSFLQGLEDHVLISSSRTQGGGQDQPIEILDDSD